MTNCRYQPDGETTRIEVLRRQENVEQEIKALDEKRRQAVLNHDVNTLARLYADEMTTVDIDGDFHVNRGNASANLNQASTRQTLKWIMEYIAVRTHGPSVAVAAIRAETQDVLRDQHRHFTQRLMDVWLKLEGRWQIVARQGTEIKEGSPARPACATLNHNTASKEQ